MNIREQKEQIEKASLSQYATLSVNSLGRDRYEEPCEVRTCFERDRDRILHSKSLRRLMHKTQVFIAPEGDHYRTRLTHTLEVSQIARSIAVALRLNEPLTEAIALGHDLGHTPFGHSGEYVLDQLDPPFEHNVQSLRIVEHLENGTGLNLTKEVRDGILNHGSECHPMTLEGRCVQFSDKIAYINHDIDDAIRAGVIREEDLPKDCIEVLGNTSAKRINTMITDIIYNSIDKPDLVKSDEVNEATLKLRQFMFSNVYIDSQAKKEEKKAQMLVRTLYEYYLENPDKMPAEYYERALSEGVKRSVCDYIAGMTDRYAIERYNELFVPVCWS